jgi:hypothetical protein
MDKEETKKNETIQKGTRTIPEKFLFGPDARKNYQIRKEERAERATKAQERIAAALTTIAESMKMGIVVKK